MASFVPSFPQTRGALEAQRPLCELTWLRVGGPAEWLFQPADEEDLSALLRALPPEVPVFPMGLGSNLIVRDGGLRGVVVRLGRAFRGFERRGEFLTVGASALDSQVALKAAQEGLDLSFLRTIPGSIGGAVRMNAGCYGRYVADHLHSVRLMTRSGVVEDMPAKALGLRYRGSDFPAGAILLSACFHAPPGAPAALAAQMEAQLARRNASQPTKARSAGSTFRNPAGFSSTGRADDVHDLKAWKLIQEAGMQGARLGGAQISPEHANFLINTGGASADDLERLGEKVRQKVFEHSAIWLEWEVMRIGERQEGG